ncbi:Rho GTPase activation protein [Papiliotrema laurentii]|uniref:Rho GTPase activation protein n=1 Tax=Papiliotrema laurentii TaxID=5418 RepID=A0AAD9L8A6_PAPLA|nr:Rho GTPase activation protein [Papiliotrema laurentii]
MEQPPPGRPLSTVSTTESVSSKPSVASSTNRLMPTLSRLSLSTSRPAVLPPPNEPEPAGYAAKTARFMSRSSKEILRRSGLAGLVSDHATSGTSSKGRSTFDVSTILYPTMHSPQVPSPQPILVLTLSRINDISPLITNDELFDVLLRRLEPWVGEEGERGYVLVVLAADQGEVESGRKWPNMGWWAWKWKTIPRKYRKNLTQLYIVHPSLFTRTLLPLVLPLISPKSYPKLHPTSSLLALTTRHRLPLAGMDLPLPVLHEEARLMRDRPDLFPEQTRRSTRYPRDANDSSSWSETISSTISYASSYLTFGRSMSDLASDDPGADKPKGYWGRRIQNVVEESKGRVPPLLHSLGNAIVVHCTGTEGVFRKTSNSILLGPLVALLDLPIASQPTLPWSEIALEDPLLPPKLLLRFFAELEVPLIPPTMYSTIRKTTTLESLRSTFLPALTSPQRLLLEFVVALMRKVASAEKENKMSPLALAIVLAPALINGPDPVGDAAMCLQPGRTLPSALMGGRGGSAQSKVDAGTLVGVLEMWIKDER